MHNVYINYTKYRIFKITIRLRIFCFSFPIDKIRERCYFFSDILLTAQQNPLYVPVRRSPSRTSTRTRPRRSLTRSSTMGPSERTTQATPTRARTFARPSRPKRRPLRRPRKPRRRRASRQDILFYHVLHLNFFLLIYNFIFYQLQYIWETWKFSSSCNLHTHK